MYLRFDILYCKKLYSQVRYIYRTFNIVLSIALFIKFLIVEADIYTLSSDVDEPK